MFLWASTRKAMTSECALGIRIVEEEEDIGVEFWREFFELVLKEKGCASNERTV